MKSVIIIGHEPLTKRLKQFFYIESYQKSGFHVEYWDFSSYFFPELKLPDPEKGDYIFPYHSLEGLESALKRTNIKEAIFVVEAFDAWKNRHFFRILSNYHCVMVHIDVYANAALALPLKARIERAFTSNMWKKGVALLQQRFYHYYKKFHHIETVRYFFSSAAARFHTDMINHPDYEIFRKLQLSSEEALVKGKYVVFLDTYFPCHPDFKFFWHFKPVSAEAYQSSLRRFFDYIEKRLEAKVVIAAHPKACYEGSEFGHRPIIKYKTAELVKHACLVISNMSNSIAYAILENKPLVLFVTDGYTKYRKINFRFRWLGKYLEKKVYNIDRYNFDRIDFSPVNEAARTNYIYQYLTSPETQERENSVILTERFHQILKGNRTNPSVS